MKILTMFLIMFLCAFSVSRNFSGNNPGNKSATFDELIGKQDHTFSLPEKKLFQFRYNANLRSETIRLKLTSLTTIITDITITSTSFGRHSSGSYDVYYDKLM